MIASGEEKSVKIQSETERIEERISFLKTRLQEIAMQTGALRIHTFGNFPEKDESGKEDKGANGFLQKVHNELDKSEAMITKIESDLSHLNKLF